MDVFNAEQFLPAEQGQQIARKVQNLDAVRAAFNDAAAEYFVLLQDVLCSLSTGLQ